MKHKRNLGFTVMEILIVIVVIGILATITTVLYREMSAKARSAKTLAHVDQWEKIIRVYQLKKTLLPEDWTCLGDSVNDFKPIPAKSIGTGQCERNMILDNPSPSWTSEYKTVATPGQSKPTAELLKDNASIFEGKLDMIEAAPDKYMRGIVYASISEPERSPNSKPGAFIFYALESRDCPETAEQRNVNDKVVMCALRLTGDDYDQEIFKYYP